MARFLSNDVPTVIHPYNEADFNQYVYTKVYYGEAGTVTINGKSIVGTAGTLLPIVVTAISTALTDVYVLGFRKQNIGRVNPVDYIKGI